MSTVWPRSTFARNRGTRRWLWRYIFRKECHSTFTRLPSKTAIAETQVPEHPGGNGLDHENGLLWEVPSVYELCPSSGVDERYRRESTCCGGWVILKKCTAYVRLHVVGFVTFFDNILSRLDTNVFFIQNAKGYELVPARCITFHLRTLKHEYVELLDTKHIPMTASTRETHRWRVFVNRSCTSWNMGNCLNTQMTWAGGETKMKKNQDFGRKSGFFALLVTMQRHLLLSSWYYGTNTM